MSNTVGVVGGSQRTASLFDLNVSPASPYELALLANSDATFDVEFWDVNGRTLENTTGGSNTTVLHAVPLLHATGASSLAYTLAAAGYNTATLGIPPGAVGGKLTLDSGSLSYNYGGTNDGLPGAGQGILTATSAPAAQSGPPITTAATTLYFGRSNTLASSGTSSGGGGGGGGVSTNFYTGQVAIAVTGTQVVLAASTPLTVGVRVSAALSNTQPIFVGPTGVTNTDGGTGNGYRLEPGDVSPLIPVNNLNLVYINGTGPDYAFYAAN